MKEILLRAPATVANFGPGFDIFALALKEPYDILKIRLNETKSITIKITGGAEDLPVSAERNTAGLAALQFLEKMNLSTGIDVEIKKGMKTMKDRELAMANGLLIPDVETCAGCHDKKKAPEPYHANMPEKFDFEKMKTKGIHDLPSAEKEVEKQ